MLLSAVVIIYNEEKNIVDCLSCLSFCDEIIVVDSGSTDRSVALAQGMKAKALTHPFTDYASQKNFGIAAARGDWVLLVDADERVTFELAREIQKTISVSSGDGYEFLRQNRIFGRWMHHGSNAGDYQLRLVKRQKAKFQGLVHERVILESPAGRLRAPLLHYSTRTVPDYMKKLNVYTDLEARIMRKNPDRRSELQMKWVPPALFVRRYFLKGEFLDGIEGFLFCILSAYYEFVKRAKCWESEMNSEGQ